MPLSAKQRSEHFDGAVFEIIRIGQHVAICAGAEAMSNLERFEIGKENQKIRRPLSERLSDERPLFSVTTMGKSMSSSRTEGLARRYKENADIRPAKTGRGPRQMEHR